jgi:branched-chain amino acid transport system substrate-binding protein
LIASTDATGIDASTAFNAIIKDPENRGMELVAQAHFAPTDISVTAQLAQIKAAQPDVVFAWSTGPAAGTVLQGLMQLGLDVPVATSYGNMSYSSMDSWSAFLPKELDFPASPWSGNAASPGLDPRVRNALRDVHAAFDAAGEKVDSGAATAWDALMITAEVLRKIGPNASPAQFRDALQRVRGFGGMNGVYDFARNPQRGLGEQSTVIARWSPAKHEWDIVSKSSGIPIDDTRR